MTEEKKEPKKREKKQIILDLEDALELNSYLESKSERQKIAKELGTSLQSVRNWRDSKRFPRYCLPYLKNLRLIKGLEK